VFRTNTEGGIDEEFGEDRLLNSFLGCPARTPEQILDSVWSGIDSFGDQEQSDDMTALVLMRLAGEGGRR
jgi:serine phosphatase RsbU (regulator of sigma subunit)